MSDPIVTHADLSVLRSIRYGGPVEDDADNALLDRLIAAAEADAPPLPEGWYAFESVMHGNLRAYVRSGGTVYQSDACTCVECYWGPVGDFAHRLSPLRPTVTKAQLHAAWLHLDGIYSTVDRDDLEVALGQAGIEVAP